MDVPVRNVAVFEDNETRAELYALWLEEFDVEVAVTKREAAAVLEEQTAVAVLDQGFADGAAETLLEIVRDAAPACRVVATRDRTSPFPSLGVDHQLAKPVFEEDLVDLVGQLALRANYQMVLQTYYQTTAQLAPLETVGDTDSETATQLQERVAKLKTMLGRLREQMDSEDVSAVMSGMTVRDIEASGEAKKMQSKYRPDKCGDCGVEWETTPDSETLFTRLGAYVWRCRKCGFVQMHVDPSYQHVSSYRK